MMGWPVVCLEFVRVDGFRMSAGADVDPSWLGAKSWPWGAMVLHRRRHKGASSLIEALLEMVSVEPGASRRT